MSKFCRNAGRYLFVVIPLTLSGCQHIKDLRSRKQNTSPKTGKLAQVMGAAIADELRPVLPKAWQKPKQLGMSNEALCVLSADGSPACAKLRDDKGMHFVPLNLLGQFDRILADPRNLCLARGEETYCKEGSGWFHAMGDRSKFGRFHRTYLLDKKTHLGLIHNDLARWDRNGSFSARAQNGVDYTIEPPQDWVAAQSSAPEEACGLEKSGAVVCYRFPSNSLYVAPSVDNPKVSLRQPQTLRFSLPARELAISSSYGCARLEDGSVSCWLPPLVGGYDKYLKDAGHSAPYPLPLPNGLAVDAAPVQRRAEPITLPTTVTTVVSGKNFVCALGRDGHVYCWGANDAGQLGQKEPIEGSRLALRVAGLQGVTGLAASGSAACAISEGRGVFCWGDTAARPSVAGMTQRTRLPVAITDRAPFDAPEYRQSEQSCSAEQRVSVEPHAWVKQLRLATERTAQAELLEQMRMTPPESAPGACLRTPKVTRASIDTTPKGDGPTSAMIVRAELSTCDTYRSVRTQVLVPISEGSYCAVVPDDIAAFDLDEYAAPCQKSPTLGNFNGPLRTAFVTLGSDKHWGLEVITATGRNDPLAEKSFWYATSYYELRGYVAVKLFEAATFRGRCSRGASGLEPAIDESRNIYLEGPVPRKLRVEECVQGAGCRNHLAIYDGNGYRPAEGDAE